MTYELSSNKNNSKDVVDVPMPSSTSNSDDILDITAIVFLLDVPLRAKTPPSTPAKSSRRNSLQSTKCNADECAKLQAQRISEVQEAMSPTIQAASSTLADSSTGNINLVAGLELDAQDEASQSPVDRQNNLGAEEEEHRDEECRICFEERARVPVKVPCCKWVYCKRCILRCANEDGTLQCPLCKAWLNSSDPTLRGPPIPPPRLVIPRTVYREAEFTRSFFNMEGTVENWAAFREGLMRINRDEDQAEV